MTAKKQISYLLQVAIPFVILGIFKNHFFFIPPALILLSLPVKGCREFLIKKWQQLSHLLSRIISPIVISLIYYVGFTPLAFFYRIMNKDAMQFNRPLNSTLKDVNVRTTPESFDDLW